MFLGGKILLTVQKSRKCAYFTENVEKFPSRMSLYKKVFAKITLAVQSGQR